MNNIGVTNSNLCTPCSYSIEREKMWTISSKWPWISLMQLVAAEFAVLLSYIEQRQERKSFSAQFI